MMGDGYVYPRSTPRTAARRPLLAGLRGGRWSKWSKGEKEKRATHAWLRPLTTRKYDSPVRRVAARGCVRPAIDAHPLGSTFAMRKRARTYPVYALARATARVDEAMPTTSLGERVGAWIQLLAAAGAHRVSCGRHLPISRCLQTWNSHPGARRSPQRNLDEVVEPQRSERTQRPLERACTSLRSQRTRGCSRRVLAMTCQPAWSWDGAPAPA